MWDDVVILLAQSFTTDEAGDTVPTTISRTIFCNKKSIGKNEFYQAHAEGLKPEIKLQLNKLDYKGEVKATYGNKPYKIIRSYEDGELIELTLEGDVHVTT